MYKTITSFFFATLLLCACFHAPSISVPLFVLDETDQTANQHGTMVLDKKRWQVCVDTHTDHHERACL